MGVHRKIQFLGWVHEKPIYRKGGLLKNGGLGQFADLKGDLAKKRGMALFFFFFFLKVGGGG